MGSRPGTVPVLRRIGHLGLALMGRIRAALKLAPPRRPRGHLGESAHQLKRTEGGALMASCRRRRLASESRHSGLGNMPVMRKTTIALVLAVALGGCAVTSGRASHPGFNDAEIRAAERALVQALESSDPTAWVYAYTEDAVFVAPGAPAVQGRAALLQMAKAMKPLSSVSINRYEPKEAAALRRFTATHPGSVVGLPMQDRSRTSASSSCGARRLTDSGASRRSC